MSTAITAIDGTAAPGRRTAGMTGLAYLGLAIGGLVGFLVVSSRLHVPDDAARTAANLVRHQTLARVGLAADLLTVLAQALAAVGFHRLFRPVHAAAAGSLAAFGLVNAVVVLVATAFSATALDAALAGGAAAPGEALLLSRLHDATWGVGALFFGLWLIPMGMLARRSGWLPRALGPLLVVGGAGYVVSAFAAFLAPGAPWAVTVLALPATAGEFWMIGCLLRRGLPGQRAR